MNVILVAVDIRSAHNIGSLFRTCDGFSANLMLVGICPRPRNDDDTRLPFVADKAHKAIAKTALGAEETVNWRHAETLLEAKNILEKEGYSLVALEQTKKSKDISRFSPKNSTAIVVGREVEGLTDVELKLCDEAYEIPMRGKKESFNVSVAAGIALYQLSVNA
jgi:23S rRNA (guanosine2251-2'-O)-methyltransferase